MKLLSFVVLGLLALIGLSEARYRHHRRHRYHRRHPTSKFDMKSCSKGRFITHCKHDVDATLSIIGGPYPGRTCRIMRAVGKAKVKASLFVDPRIIKRRPKAADIASQAFTDGHVVGMYINSDRWSGRYMSKDFKFKERVKQGLHDVGKYAFNQKVSPLYVRLVGSKYSHHHVHVLRKLGLHVVRGGDIDIPGERSIRYRDARDQLHRGLRRSDFGGLMDFYHGKSKHGARVVAKLLRTLRRAARKNHLRLVPLYQCASIKPACGDTQLLTSIISDTGCSYEKKECSTVQVTGTLSVEKKDSGATMNAASIMSLAAALIIGFVFAF